MTKKSAARIERDRIQSALKKAVKDPKNKNTYAQVMQSRAHAVEALKMMGNIGHELKKHDHLIPFLANREETNDNIRVLVKDLNRFKEMIEVQYQRHAKRTGRARDGEDLLKAMDITQQYASIVEAMDGICRPVANAIMEDYQVAEDRYKIANGQEARPLAQAMANGAGISVDVKDGVPELVIAPVEETVSDAPDAAPAFVAEAANESVVELAEDEQK